MNVAKNFVNLNFPKIIVFVVARDRIPKGHFGSCKSTSGQSPPVQKLSGMVSQLPAQKDGEKPTPENLSDTFSENSYGSIDSSDTNSSADSGNSSGSDSSAESDNSAGSYTSCDIERDIEMEIARSYSYPESEKYKSSFDFVSSNQPFIFLVFYHFDYWLLSSLTHY